MGGKINDIWALFTTVQLSSYLSFYQVTMPTNVEIYLSHFRDTLKLQFITPNLRSLFANKDTEMPSNLVSFGMTDSFIANLGIYPVFLLIFSLACLIAYFVRN